MQDDKLLTRYAQDGSEAAFGQIVARHLTLVYSTCLRETGSPSQAEDAAQVVFLLLARKARSLRAGPSLAGWLYNAARFVAKDVRKQEARRQRREQTVMQEMTQRQEPPAPERQSWQDVEPLLNDALSALKPGEREAVLLRFIEGRSLAETGAALGLSEDAARMRVSRAVEKMRRYLTSHGASVTGLILTGLLTSEVARPVPAHAAAVTQATLQAIASGPTVNILLLSKGVYQTMKIIKVKFAALAAVLVLGGMAVVPLAHALSPHKTSLRVLATPAPLTENVTTKFTLDKDQHAFYSFTLPRGASTIILDMRQADNKAGNMGCHLSFYNSATSQLQGSTNALAREMFVNSMEAENRVVARCFLRQPKSLTLDIHNQSEQCQYWLTVSQSSHTVNANAFEASPSLVVPLFGDIVPKAMALNESKMGRLQKNECAYFLISLKAGAYQSVLDFSTLSGKTTGLIGDLGFSDEKGLLLFNEGSTSATGSSSIIFNGDPVHHDVSRFALKTDGVFLVQIANPKSRAGDTIPVNFSARILADTEASAAK